VGFENSASASQIVATTSERWPTIHVAYLSPHAYEEFAKVDPERPWRELVRSSYEVLRFVFVEKGLALPPERIWVEPRSGALLLERPGAGPAPSGYDSVPIYWRVALDARWHGRRGEADLRARMLRFPAEEWRAEGRLRDRHTAAGRAVSDLDGLPQMASVHALALEVDPVLAEDLRARRVEPLFQAALEATEEAVYNSLLMATTVTSRAGTAEALPIDRVREILRKYGVTPR